ncbi:translocator protein-like [Convolutriloba macropyga]|uniref:translocator protein-like n=1 Tax=Convolutriloba macropyga TaxID=536237 RepID=UPI003F5207D2
MINWEAVGMTALPVFGGLASGFLFCRNRENKEWNNKLVRLRCNPPEWIFGPVWTTLYGMMGYASYRILSLRETSDVSMALTAYGVQLALNMSWTPVFFTLHKIKTAGVIATCVCGSIIWTIKEFQPLDLTASRLLYPYIAWCTFATFLNWSIAYLNSDNKALKND